MKIWKKEDKKLLARSLGITDVEKINVKVSIIFYSLNALLASC